jgi:hypothetical protein
VLVTAIFLRAMEWRDVDKKKILISSVSLHEASL